MKKIISVSILLLLLLAVYQLCFTILKKDHEVIYQITKDKKSFEIVEKYQKDYYDITIKDSNNITFYYTIPNHFNKQQNIIEDIFYEEENNNQCIYVILRNEEKSYIECEKEGKLYSEFSYPDVNLVAKLKNTLLEKRIPLATPKENSKITTLKNSTIYIDNLLTTDTITLWNYKGVQVIHPGNLSNNNILNFDKYENKHGCLVGNYYIVPSYTSSKVLEFNKVNLLNLDTLKIETIDLKYTLSSDTYINGIVEGKLYYMDPSNLLQIEINVDKKNSHLIGNKELGGQNYQGSWETINIYDFKTNIIKFKEAFPSEVNDKYSYIEMIETNSSYYYYNQAGQIYQIPKNHLDSAILINQNAGLNNVKIIDDSIYYVLEDTLYYFDRQLGSIPILKNNELKYNKENRIDVRRKKGIS